MVSAVPLYTPAPVPAEAQPQPQAEPRHELRSTLVSRNVTVSGRRTSIRLEPEMWDGLREICRRERTNMHHICTSVAQQKPERTSLTAAIRVFAMRYFRLAATEEGHNKAGHGFGLALALASNGAACYPRPAAILTKSSFA